MGLLGPFLVHVGGVDRAITAGKQRVLLALLALHTKESVSGDRLIEAIWGERAPASAAHALAVYASALRRVLGAGLIERNSDGYRLAVPRDSVDVFRFEAMAAEGRAALETGDSKHAALLLAEALRLCRGDPLTDVPSEALETERERIRSLWLNALEDRIEVDLALGRHLALVPELESLVRAEPLRERPLRLLMVALYRSGRQAEALAHYRTARSYLHDELGLEPGPELKALERAILGQDPTLDVPRDTTLKVPLTPLLS